MQNGLRAKVHCFGKEHVCLGDDDCPGDDVFQLSDISRPFVCIEALQGLVRNLGDIAPVLGGVFSEEVASQQHGITMPVAQRGKPQRNDVETVEQVLAELPFRDQSCLLYTSDAADDLLCVDLGGRRIIKKKKTYNDADDL